MTLSLDQIAAALGGEVRGSEVLAPGPGHSHADRSLAVKVDENAPDGFLVHSFADNDPIACKNYVREKLGLAPFEPNGKASNGGDRVVCTVVSDQVMALHRETGDRIDDDSDQTVIFAPFAGTEGYTPIAYLPYIPAAAMGRLLRLDLPEMLLLMRLFGLAVFSAVTAYAIWVSPVLKWAFVFIAMLPVSLFNRSVLSADGAALCSAFVVTAFCLRGARNVSAGRLWERSVWMTLVLSASSLRSYSCCWN